ncbi:zinc finger protein ZAT10-like [Lotus japonicus]|uniref:zinc finger protein ZAT10-like n=1 Tax=Lotus japonicus TaxID=34305 RepID=UPI002583BD7B|nr:zinc finger protein ZAT10-like [Lotus japonicus]
MEEDNHALFSWKGKNKDHSCSEISHENSNMTNQSGDVSPGTRLRIKIKGPTAPTIAANAINNNIEQQPYLCHICNKGFISVNALSGHMRVHSLSKRNKDHNNNCSSKHTCSLCRKTFPSNKSLCGHMRVHSAQSVRKSGIESPLRWPVSRKRSPRFSRSSLSSFKENSCLESKGFEEVDPLMQEAAYTLVLMSKGKV